MTNPIFKRRHDLLIDALDLYMQDDPDKMLLIDEDNKYSVRKTFRIATFLALELKKYLHPKERIIVKARRDLGFLLLFFALRMAGFFLVLADFRDDVYLLRKEQNLDDVRFYLDEEDDTWVLHSFDSEKKVPLSFEESDEKVDYVEDASKPSFMIFTSGSTSKKKAVLLNEEALTKNVDATSHLGNYSVDDISMVVLPLNHIFGIAQVFYAICLRHTLFLPQKGVDPSYLLDCIEKYHITRMNGVPTIYLEMASLQKESPRNISSLKTGFIGGGPSLPSQLVEIENSLPPLKLIPVYGMSECLVITTSDYFDDDDHRRNALGKPYPESDVRIDNEEIILKSPYLFSGYDEKEEYLDEEGYFHTGDLGFFDKEGYLHLKGRKKDIIIRNGNNISAFAIQEALSDIKEVREACVLGLEDKKEGEVPVAFLILDKPCSEAYILEKLHQSLKKNMIPKRIVFLESFPKTYSGKVDRLALKRGLLNE